MLHGVLHVRINVSAVAICTRYLPPLAGVLGDPQFFVLESRDDDRETRVFDPVAFSLPGSGQVDLVTNAMDQGCCFGYGFCQKRLNAFWTVLPMGHTVAVSVGPTTWPYIQLTVPCLLLHCKQ